LFWTPSFGRGFHHVVKVITGLLVYYSIVNLIDDEKSFVLVLSVWLLIAVALAVHGVYETATTGVTASQQLVIKEGYTHLGRSVRTSSVVGSPDNLGIMLNLAIVVVSAILLSSPSRNLKTVLGIAMCIMVVSLVATFSRKSYLGTSVGTMFVVANYKKPFRAVLIGLFGTGLILVVIFAMFPSIADVFVHRLSTYLAPLEVSISERAATWKFALNLFKRSPVLGHGVGSFYVIALQADSPLFLIHNFYIYVLTELGFIGFALFLFCMIQIVREYVQFYRNIQDRSKRILAAGMIGGVIGLAIQAGFRTFGLTDPIFWGFYGLTSAFWKVHKKNNKYSERGA
jgi:O-antigen ligase